MGVPERVVIKVVSEDLDEVVEMEAFSMLEDLLAKATVISLTHI